LQSSTNDQRQIGQVNNNNNDAPNYQHLVQLQQQHVQQMQQLQQQHAQPQQTVQLRQQQQQQQNAMRLPSQHFRNGHTLAEERIANVSHPSPIRHYARALSADSAVSSSNDPFTVYRRVNEIRRQCPALWRMIEDHQECVNELVALASSSSAHGASHIPMEAVRHHFAPPAPNVQQQYANDLDPSDPAYEGIMESIFQDPSSHEAPSIYQLAANMQAHVGGQTQY
jgi:DNA-binding FrmR family transcriptional regulator